MRDDEGEREYKIFLDAWKSENREMRKSLETSDKMSEKRLH